MKFLILVIYSFLIKCVLHALKRFKREKGTLVGKFRCFFKRLSGFFLEDLGGIDLK